VAEACDAKNGYPGGVVLVDLGSGKERLAMPWPGEESARCVAFSPDSRSLAAGGSDGIVRVFEVASARERRRFAGHRGDIVALDFSPDGRRLLSGSDDTTALIWDVTGLEQDGARALGAKDTAALWQDLADTDAAKAGRAVWRLVGNPAAAVALLRERLRPVVMDAALVERLLTRLESDDFSERQAAQRDLTALGSLAEPALRKARAAKLSPEARRRATEVLENLDGPLTLPGELRAVRSVEVLEQIGSGEARQVLRRLAGGAPEARLTQEARAALDRRRRRP
jgi:hypothetical protein